MKETAKQLVAITANNALIWKAYQACGHVGNYFNKIYGHARFARQKVEHDQAADRIVRELFPTLTVANGPFRGMKYPSLRSVGSALLPKLLGSYESELHPLLEEMLTRDYSTVVDIGCAEGYYAVGLALRLKTAEVFAFDTDSRGREACAEMARVNNVHERIYIGSLCDAAKLRSLPLGPKALIVADCEGYEKTLFDYGLAEALARHDLIVETHDFVEITISDYIKDVFARTHCIRSVKSTDDIEKAHLYKYDQLKSYDMSERRFLLAERRPAIMEWLVMKSLASSTRG